jgi:hypothetical protein
MMMMFLAAEVGVAGIEVAGTARMAMGVAEEVLGEADVVVNGILGKLGRVVVVVVETAMTTMMMIDLRGMLDAAVATMTGVKVDQHAVGESLPVDLAERLRKMRAGVLQRSHLEGNDENESVTRKTRKRMRTKRIKKKNRKVRRRKLQKKRKRHLLRPRRLPSHLLRQARQRRGRAIVLQRRQRTSLSSALAPMRL